MTGELTRVVAGAMAVFIALIFLRAAIHKLADPDRFRGILADYGLLPEPALPLMRWAIPALEGITAGALMWQGSRPLGAWLGVGLLLTYGAAISVNLLRGRSEIDCGCGGAPEPLSPTLVARNLGLAAAAAPAALGKAPLVTSAEVLTSWALAGVAMLCWGAAEQAMVNAARISAYRREALTWLPGATS